MGGWEGRCIQRCGWRIRDRGLDERNGDDGEAGEWSRDPGTGDDVRKSLSGLKTSYVGINQRGFDSLPQRPRRAARKLILI